jgi:hypothetical protein
MCSAERLYPSYATELQRLKNNFILLAWVDSQILLDNHEYYTWKNKKD